MLIFLCLLILGGCSAPTVGQPESRVIAVDRELLWRSCREVIRNYGFESYLAQSDKGLILTNPQTSAQWFEFWRKDTPTEYALAESSLHAIRRHIQLEISSNAVSEQNITCAVAVERLYRMEDDRALRYATNIFSQGLSSGIPRRQLNQDDVQWVPLGFDADLQKQILDDIDCLCHRSNTAL